MSRRAARKAPRSATSFKFIERAFAELDGHAPPAAQTLRAGAARHDRHRRTRAAPKPFPSRATKPGSWRACISSRRRIAIGRRSCARWKPTSCPISRSSTRASTCATRARTADVSAFKRSLGIRHLVCGSCNGCEHEMNALTNPFYDITKDGWDVVASPRHADVISVTGPMTDAMREAAQRTLEAAPEPFLVLAVGDCATGDGPWAGRRTPVREPVSNSKRPSWCPAALRRPAPFGPGSKRPRACWNGARPPKRRGPAPTSGFRAG